MKKLIFIPLLFLSSCMVYYPIGLTNEQQEGQMIYVVNQDIENMKLRDSIKILQERLDKVESIMETIIGLQWRQPVDIMPQYTPDNMYFRFDTAVIYKNYIIKE